MKQSELQLAANDVREIQAAIEGFEAAKVECLNGVAEARAKVTQAQLVLAQEQRQLADTQDLLNAQHGKLYRELERVRNLTYQGENGEKTQAVAMVGRNKEGVNSSQGRPIY
jgi:hypothetical protein